MLPSSLGYLTKVENSKNIKNDVNSISYLSLEVIIFYISNLRFNIDDITHKLSQTAQQSVFFS